ncbi:polyprenyl synthetase [Halapricum sp. CBA1109]|uniref:polyprenyl synthetase n=1 Tax=Halapricum sp. CBA1109 TaxID=2668068 RepID=UPI0012FADB0D|nr:polyprenyl synthetase [Halapricum sp. CBA1109]MUV89690.1 polyprenyl synthetase [Halapricum sp. CBA1109]
MVRDLAVSAYTAFSADDGVDPALPAAAAVELLRGYALARNRLLARASDDDVPPAETTTTLLAGDLLYTAAFTALGRGSGVSRAGGFEVLSEVVSTVTTTFAAAYAEESCPPAEFVDGTAGAVGAGAARLGATLAEGTPTRREIASTVGEGLATAREIHRRLGPGTAATVALPTDGEVERLRDHAERRREQAIRALDELDHSADDSPLRVLARRSAPASGIE